MAMKRAVRNYKDKSRAANLLVESGFARAFSALLLLDDACTDATTSRSSKHRTAAAASANTSNHTSNAKTQRQTRCRRGVEHAASAREVLIATANGQCKSSSSDAPFGCLAVPSCLHHPALASPLTASAIQEGTSDARPPADGGCNREPLRRYI